MQGQEVVKTCWDAFVMPCEQISPVLIGYISLQELWLYLGMVLFHSQKIIE